MQGRMVALLAVPLVAAVLPDATVGRRRSGCAALEIGYSQRTLEEAVQ